MKNQIEDVYSLSPTQEGMLYHHLSDASSGDYVSQIVFAITGDWQPVHLEDSLSALLAKYQALRAIFIYKNIKRPQQVIVKQQQPKVYFEDIASRPTEEQQHYLFQFYANDRRQGFDLSKGPLLRLSAFKVGAYSYKLLFTWHHIILDGWSLPLVISDFFRFGQLSKRALAIPEENSPAYSTYIKWLSQQDKEAALAYWKQYLSGYEVVATIPKSTHQASDVSTETRSIVRHSVNLSKQVTATLQALAATCNTTFSTVFQALWGLVLQRYSGPDDVVFGWATSGRPPELPDVEQMVGLFINTVPVRVSRPGSATFISLLETLREANWQAQSCEHVGLAAIQQQSALKAHLINHLVVFQNYPKSTAPSEAEQESITLETSAEQTNYDFDVIAVPGEELKVFFEYNALHYPAWLVDNIAAYLVQLAEVVAYNPDLPLHDSSVVALLPHEQALLETVNTTQRTYPQGQTLADLLEEQVARTPEQTALVFEGQRLSYQQLNQQANNVAHYLQTHYALAPDDCVGLLMERSSNLIIAMLGILKAGAAYVPLDPTYPEQRQQAILRESNCKVVLTQATARALLPCPSVDITLLPEAHKANPRRTTQPQHLAYVIYSSGTTGKPKGIMIEHRSIVNLLYYYNEKYGLPQQNGILQVTNVIVDIALQEVFSALMNGLTLYVPTQEMIYDPAALRQYLQQHRISFVQLIPDTLRAYLAGQPKLDGLQAVLCGGDKLPDKLRDQVLEQDYPLYNVYGQTETTIDALVSRCQIGESGLEEVVANYQVHVLDSQGRRQPLGVAGEICIGGVGVGRGYLNEEALTNEKFVDNPFGEGRLYKTGDLGRWLVNGRLEFIGRADTQVKVRGYRIELAEVERALLSNAQLQEAVVVAQGEASEEKYLCAYYILTGTGGMPSGKLREYLQSLLPSYMVPSYLLEVGQLPVNANGKIDRSALPLPDKTHHSKNYLAPRNEIEEKLAQVWQDVLKAGPISLNDNFFELGGDSIKGIQVIARLQQKGLKLSMAHLMQYPRLQEAALQVKPLTVSLDQGLVQGAVKLTPVQQWFFDFNFTNPHHFSMPWMLYRPEGFEERYIRQVLEALTLQHDALRMVYRSEQGQVRQYNRGREGELYDLQVVSVQGAEDEGLAIEQASTRLHASVNLTTGPLLKARLFQASNGDHLLLSIHHLIMDGVSWRIVLEDFATAYQQLQQGKAIHLPAKTSSFQQWADAIHAYARGAQMQEEVAYWQQVEKDLLAITPPRPDAVGTTADTAVERISLNEQHTRRLQHEVHQAYSTQTNDILLTALGLALQEWSGQGKHIVMLEGHGREEVVPGADVTRTVGWFTAHFLQPLAVEFPHDLSYQLRSVKEQLRQVPHKGIGYEIWKHLLNQEQPVERVYPLVNFNYLGEFTAPEAAVPFRPSPYAPGIDRSEDTELVTDIEIVGNIRAGKLTFRCTYNSRRFAQPQIAQLMQLFQQQLLNVIDHCATQMERALTPSDFSANDLSLDDLALLQGRFNNF